MSYENLRLFTLQRAETEKHASVLGAAAKGLGAAGLGAALGGVATRRREGEDDAAYTARRRRGVLLGGGAGLATYGAARGIAALRRPKPELDRVRGLIGGPGEAPEQLQRLRAQMRDSERQGRVYARHRHAAEDFIERVVASPSPAERVAETVAAPPQRAPLAGLPQNKSRRGVQRAPRPAPVISGGPSPAERVAETVAAPPQRASSALQLGYEPSVVNTPSASVPRSPTQLRVRRDRADVVRAASPAERVAETVAPPRQRAVKPRMSEEQREALKNSPEAVKLRKSRDLPWNRHPDKEGPPRTDLFAMWRKRAADSARGYSDEKLERDASGVDTLSGPMSRAAARRELKIRKAQRDAELESMPSYLDFGD